MHVVCAMFSRQWGGLEQSLLDFCEALTLQGHRVTAFIYPGSVAEKKLEIFRGKNVRVEKLVNFGQWDLIAKLRMRFRLKRLSPDAAITFGNRSVALSKFAARGICPIIASTPNYSVKRMLGFEGIFHTTQHIKQHLLTMGQQSDRLFHIPNMITVPTTHTVKLQPYRKPVVIGTIGRFVPKKGFDVFIRALERLMVLKVEFVAIIGGAGAEDANLRDLATRLNLGGKVKFINWVENKSEFFESIDIFCLPSLIEPFGIVLLEAFLFGKPVVTTDAEGPREIATDGDDALIVPKGNPDALATALQRLIQDESLAKTLSINAQETIKNKYDINIVSKNISAALDNIIAKKPKI